MRVISICAIATGVLSLGAGAIRLVERDRPAVVQFGIERRSVESPIERDRLRRRQSQTVSQTLDNEVGASRSYISSQVADMTIHS
jgi:hypothetical protein